MKLPKKLAEKSLVGPAFEKGLEPFREWLTSGYEAKKPIAICVKPLQ
jgi:hypothetical protein